MKKILSLIVVCFIISSAYAQVEGGIYEKLEKLYLKGSYESCMFKAEDMTYNDKYKKDAEPYLYVAFCNYQLSISEDPYIIEDYPNALKDAVKFLIKFKKKDKDNELTIQNDGMINSILGAYFEEANEFFKLKDYKKAAYNYKQLANWYDENTDLIFMEGICNALEGKTTAGQNFDESIPVLLEQVNSGKLKVRRELKVNFADSFILYADYLYANEEADSARATLDLGLKLLPVNINLKTKIDSLKN